MLALAACGGSGDSDIGGGGGGGGGGTGNPTPDDPVIDPGDLPVDGTETCGDFVCSGDVTGITFDGTTLTLTGLPFDDDPDGAVFTKVGEITGTTTTIDGTFARNFDIYENTDNVPIPGFNRYLAVYQETSGGEMKLGVAAIQGYQNFGYSGAWYDVDELTTTIPTLGLFEFEGNYAGTMTFEGDGGLFLTRGEVTMQVDFTDSKLKGFITDRAVLNPDTLAVVQTLNTLVLNDTTITDGSFEGTVNSYDGTEVLETGTYQGFFGGAGGDVVGGLVQAFNPEYDLSGVEESPNEDIVRSRDLGIFTADKVPFP